MVSSCITQVYKKLKHFYNLVLLRVMQTQSMFCFILVFTIHDAEHKMYRVHSVQGVNNKVKDCHEGDHHQLIPGTEVTTVMGSLFVVRETVEWPDHHSCRVHHCCQNVIDNHHHVEGDRQVGGQLCEGEQDYDDGKDKTQGIHSHTPLDS